MEQDKHISPPIKIKLAIPSQLNGFVICLFIDFRVSGFTKTHLD